MTNFERWREMTSTIEGALRHELTCRQCIHLHDTHCNVRGMRNITLCREGIAAWLKQEREEKQ